MKKLSELIETTIENCGTERTKVKAAALEAVKRDRSIVMEVMEELIEREIDRVINQHYHQHRLSAWKNEGGEMGDSLARGIVAQHQKSILDYPLSDGKPLREANRLDLRREYGYYRERAVTEAVKARWFGSMMRAMPDEESKVGTVLGENKVLNFKSLAEKQAGAGRHGAKQIEASA